MKLHDTAFHVSLLVVGTDPQSSGDVLPAGAAVNAEKMVDLPTFGKPTIPQLIAIFTPLKNEEFRALIAVITHGVNDRPELP